MRLTSLLLAIAVVISFLAGKFFFTIKDSIDSIVFDEREVTHVIRQFVTEKKAEKIVDLAQMFPTTEQYTKSGLSRLLENSLIDQNIDYSSKQSCNVAFSTMILSARAQQKFEIWRQFICEDTPLPENFFAEPPFIHPSGHSYILLAIKTSEPQYRDNRWLKDHLKYLELTEFPFLLQTSPHILEGSDFEWLSKSSTEELDLLKSGTTFFLLGQYLIIQDRSLSQQFFDLFFSFDQQPSKKEVLLYNKNTIDDFLRKTHFRIGHITDNKSCLIKQNNICWNYSILYFFHYANTTTLLVLALTFALLFIVLWQILKRMAEDKREENNRRLALQILTHEFRTPIASLVLQSELLNKHSDLIPDRFEEHWSEISTNIFRLQRLAEMSKNYLQVSKKGEFHLKPQLVPSLNELLQDIVEEFEIKDQKINLLTHDCSALIDIYWLRLCLKNLIENAKRYGVMPIEISLKTAQKDLFITVKDQGICSMSTLKELTKEFNKADTSPGIGLGLNIVAGTVKGMGGELLFNQSPTTFTIHLKGVIKNEQ